MENYDVIESFMGAMDFDSPHISDSVENYSLEGIFFDEKNPPKWVTKNVGLVEYRDFTDGDGRRIVIPGNNWEKEFFIKNPNITEGLKKNGARFLKTYIGILEQAYNHYMKIKSEWMSLDSGESSRYGEIRSEFQNKYFSKMSMINREYGPTLTGLPVTADKSFLSQMAPLLGKFKKIFSNCTDEYLEVRMMEIQKSSIKRTFNTKSVRNVKSKMFIPSELFLFCQDVWHIISSKCN